MSEYLFDEALVARLTREMQREFDRSGHPDDFPALSEIAAARYTSQEFYELEQQYLWPNSWVCAGRLEDLPGNGSYFLFDELGHPLIVIRGADGEVRCFSNTCRHRGAPVVREPSGTVRHMRCQYHAWTYDITGGDLVAVTDERDFPGLCKDEKGLPEISCDTWGGWVWINMNANANAEPLLDFLGRIPAEMEQFQCEELRLVGTDHREVDCNWKVAVEAFQEVYHFRFLHDRGGFSVLDSRGAVMGLLENGNSRMVVPQSKQVVELGGRESWSDYRVQPNPHGFEPIPTVHPIVHSTSYSFTIFPNLITPLGAAGFPVMLFFPDGPGRTRIRIYHYAPQSSSASAEAQAERQASFGRIIDEDMTNLAPMHRAMSSRLYHSVPISYQERRIWHMNEVIDQTIGVERIPEALRVDQLLGGQIEL